jgi:hypothetical protein
MLKNHKTTTVKDALLFILIINGMNDQQAQAVFNDAKPKIENLLNDYSVTFESPVIEYPDVVITTIYKQIKPIALAWLNKNKPNALFKQAFA